MSKTVRYAKDSSGLNVRSDAAGSVTRAINYGQLMVHDSADKPVRKALNGTTYTWLKVTYWYQGTNDKYLIATEATGWVAQENTSTVSTTIPGKSSVLTGDKSYRQDERLGNARYICNYLRSLATAKRWTTNAICATLGNMEAESGMTPGRWEIAGDTQKGFGLVQWTPSTKFTDALTSGQSKTDIDVQLKRIQAEVDGTYEQWLSQKHSPQMTFKQYTQSSKTVSVLAEYFLRCYENPNIYTGMVSERQRCAQKWNALLSALGDI